MLAQEAFAPSGHPSAFRSGGVRGDGWGSSTVTSGPQLPLEEITHATGMWRGRQLRDEPAPLLRTMPGCTSVAKVQTERDLALTVISTHAVTDDESGYMTSTLWHVLADLQPLFDDPNLNEHIILGGDLNTGTQWRGSEDERFLARDAAALELIKSLGLVDIVDRHLPPDRGRLPNCRCTYGDDCRHVWTQRNPRWPDTPYQTDYLFVSPSLVDAVTNVEIVTTEEVWALSDHAPIVVDLDIR